MQKIILTIVGSALIAVSSVQIAAAAEHHRGTRAHRATLSEPVRNANDTYAFPTPSVDYGGSNYAGGAISAPAGRN